MCIMFTSQTYITCWNEYLKKLLFNIKKYVTLIFCINSYIIIIFNNIIRNIYISYNIVENDNYITINTKN